MTSSKKAGEECVGALQLDGEQDPHQPLCIDEKWIKVRDRWHYVFTAVGAKVTDLLAIDLFYSRNKQAMKMFLLSLKAAGFRPKAIITDLLAVMSAWWPMSSPTPNTGSACCTQSGMPGA